MGDYRSLNVLNQRKDYMSNDAITEVANMINNSGANRKQRRKLARDLGKVENILSHTQKHVNDLAYKEYCEKVDKNFLHFFAVLAITMGEDYKWREDDTHDQISSLLERVGKKIDKYSAMGYATEDLVKLVDEKYDIQLISDVH